MYNNNNNNNNNNVIILHYVVLYSLLIGGKNVFDDLPIVIFMIVIFHCNNLSLEEKLDLLHFMI